MVVPPDAMPPAGAFCSLPGSVMSTAQGPAIVPGGDPSLPDLSKWLTVPPGFCAHYYATGHAVRQLRFAPGGDLFAALPSAGTTGGRGDASQSIVVLPDDDHDGVADTTITFLGNMSHTQGLLFTGSYLYYQDDVGGTRISRVVYHAGDRAPASSPAQVVDFKALGVTQDGGHWPKVLDVAQDGTIYVTNGGSQGDVCLSGRPLLGAVYKLNPNGTLTLAATGLRNPIAIRCQADRNVCVVAELAKDYSFAPDFGREKLVPVIPGAPVADWGYPCCATRDIPYSGVMYADNGQSPNCSGVAAENGAFFIGHTPFGLDFETGKWPAPWNNRVYLALHGIVGSFVGARVVAIALDPVTGVPLPASELEGSMTDPSNMLEFATGWDNGKQDHGRPAAVAFAPDGRLFLGDDWKGAVIWIAPIGLMRP